MEWYDRLIAIIFLFVGLSSVGYWIELYLKISKAPNKPVFLDISITEKTESLAMSDNAFEMAKNDYSNLTVGKEFNWIDFNNWLNN